MSRRIASAWLAVLFVVIALPYAARAGHGRVLVVGGTPAAVAAAVAAARRGEDVTLVARGERLGGVLTDAMMDQWDLNLSRDGAPIEAGLFREIYADLGDSFSPAAAARTFAALVAAEPRIRLLTGARPIAARTTGAGDRSVTSVTFLSTREHRVFEVAAATVIDATDDGDVAALAGARYTIGRQDEGIDRRMQPVTLLFTLEGVDWPAVIAGYAPKRFGAGGATDRSAWGYAKLMAAYRPHDGDVLVPDLNFGHENGGAVTVNAIDVLGVDGRFDAELARARSLAEREAPDVVAFLRTHLAGFEHARLGRYADALYVRETRHFDGLERLTASDVWDGRIPPDTIGLSSYPIDVHPVVVDERPAYAPVRHVYGIPFGSLVPAGFANVILASPAISASHLASGSARVIPTTIEEGEAAGAAAALAQSRGLTFPQIAGRAAALDALRVDLRAHGAILTVRLTVPS
jgi:hypothetical protein